MPEPSFHTQFIFSPLNEGDENGASSPQQYSERYLTDLTSHVEELQTVNEQLRQARRAALNLMEDAILSQEALRINEHRIRRQNEAFQAAINGAAFTDSLNIMATLVMEETGARTAFYFVNEDLTCLHPVWGAGNMAEGYLRKVDPFVVGENSFACGLAVSIARPVITPDIQKEPLWQQWASIAEQYNIRGCWSFPINTRDHQVVGTFAMYFSEAREATPTELALAEMVTQTAGVIISSHINAQARMRAEEALRLSEARFRTLADAIPQLIWTNDPAGKANYFNLRWYEYSGLTYEESYDVGWEAMVHPDDASASIKKWKKSLMVGEVFDTEYRLRRHDGSYRWFIGRNVPVKDNAGKITGWFGTATDIEDLKKTEEELSQSEEWLRVTMESATDYAIITMDTERRIEKWSSGAAQIFGWSEAEIIGQSADIIFTEEDRAAGAPQAEMEIARNTGRAADERWHQRRDGSRFYMSGVMRPIYNQELTGYVKVARDMTQQKLSTEELHRLVAERTIELQQTNESLRQFATVAAHDLQEPLRKLRLFSSVLQRFRDKLPEEGSELVAKIYHTSERMGQLISEVLQYSKIAYGVEEFLPTNLDRIVQNVLADLDLLVTETGATIVYEEALPEIEAVPPQMNQLFYNLLTNALKFRKEGRKPVVRISFQPLLPEQVKAHADFGANTAYIEIKIADNGIGFDEQFSEQIFHIFERLHSTDEFEGTGVGLALCKKITENHHGHIFATSKEGEGAVFHVVLPVTQVDTSK